MTQYTDADYRLLLVAREVGQRHAVRNLREHMAIAAHQAGDAWLTDPRRVGMLEALSVIESHTRQSLDDETQAEIARLLAMANDLDKRPASDSKIPLS